MYIETRYEETKKTWKTWYFDFGSSTDPNSLIGKTLKVREKTGSLNVREGMPTWSGQFQKVVDVLSPESETIINEIKEWSSSGYMWAQITYGK